MRIRKRFFTLVSEIQGAAWIQSVPPAVAGGLCTKSRNSVCGAPKARNMIARGKRRAERGASPLGHKDNEREALKERNK